MLVVAYLVEKITEVQTCVVDMAQIEAGLSLHWEREEEDSCSGYFQSSVHLHEEGRG